MSIIRQTSDKRISDLLRGYEKLSEEGIIRTLTLSNAVYFKTMWMDNNFFHWMWDKKKGHPLMSKYFRSYGDVWFLRVSERERNIKFWLVDGTIQKGELLSFGDGEEYYFDIYNDRRNFHHNDHLVNVLGRGLSQILELKAQFYEEYCKEKGIEI